MTILTTMTTAVLLIIMAITMTTLASVLLRYPPIHNQPRGSAASHLRFQYPNHTARTRHLYANTPSPVHSAPTMSASNAGISVRIGQQLLDELLSVNILQSILFRMINQPLPLDVPPIAIQFPHNWLSSVSVESSRNLSAKLSIYQSALHHIWINQRDPVQKKQSPPPSTFASQQHPDPHDSHSSNIRSHPIDISDDDDDNVDETPIEYASFSPITILNDHLRFDLHNLSLIIDSGFSLIGGHGPLRDIHFNIHGRLIIRIVNACIHFNVTPGYVLHHGRPGLLIHNVAVRFQHMDVQLDQTDSRFVELCSHVATRLMRSRFHTIVRDGIRNGIRNEVPFLFDALTGLLRDGAVSSLDEVMGSWTIPKPRVAALLAIENLRWRVVEEEIEVLANLMYLHDESSKSENPTETLDDEEQYASKLSYIESNDLFCDHDVVQVVPYPGEPVPRDTLDN